MLRISKINLTTLLLVSVVTTVAGQAPDLGRQIVLTRSPVQPQLTRTTATSNANHSRIKTSASAALDPSMRGRQPEGWTTSGEPNGDARTMIPTRAPFTAVDNAWPSNHYRDAPQNEDPAVGGEEVPQVTDAATTTTDRPASRPPVILSTSLPQDFQILVPTAGSPLAAPPSFGSIPASVNANPELSMARSLNPMPMIDGPITGQFSARNRPTTSGVPRPLRVSPVQLGPPPPTRRTGGCALRR